LKLTIKLRGLLCSPLYSIAHNGVMGYEWISFEKAYEMYKLDVIVKRECVKELYEWRNK
jgi:hypothetical protein